MRKLTDVYIKVNKSNVEELRKLLNCRSIMLGENIGFDSDDYKCFTWVPLGTEKVSLSQLKRLIDTIPTREEITRLKQKISGYKTNLLLANKDNEILVDSMKLLDDKLEATEERLKRYSDNLNSLQKENESLRNEIKRGNDFMTGKVAVNEDELELLRNKTSNYINHLEKKLNIQADLIRDKNSQLEQLKQRKFWQFWK